ncbi:MAG TPA: glycosyltransferase family 2 protein [Mycobacterium sp.]|nr:glycosyltransferase family 2 protein [Mycobacterium sp.]
MGSLFAVSVVVVTYNSATTIRACLASIPRDCEVVVVDQSSSDDTIVVASSVRHDARIISAGSNRGFGSGCNLGAANAQGDVLIFMNPDGAFLDGAVKSLVQQVRIRDALVGPRITDEDGFDQTRARFWSTPLSILGEVCLPTALTKVLLLRDIPPEYSVYRHGGPVPYVQGTCMAVSAKNFWLAGGFDERFFLYHEEEVLARRLESIGVPAVLNPAAVITHLGARSTSQVRDFAARQYYRSAALAMMLHHRLPTAIPAAVALWLLLEMMAILTPVRMRIGLRKEKYRSWYRSGAAGAAAGLFGRVVLPPPAARPTNVLALTTNSKVV